MYSDANKTQVFHQTRHSYALVNLKPLLPGHVLIVPHRRVARLTSLSFEETADLFQLVKQVQRMLAWKYFPSSSTPRSGKVERQKDGGKGGSPENGSFNIALQDGPAAGQSVPHVHVHIIPRSGDGLGDGLYDLLSSEEGNVGGKQWDKAMWELKEGRPEMRPSEFPKIEDGDRAPRDLEVMREEAEMFGKGMEELERRERVEEP